MFPRFQTTHYGLRTPAGRYVEGITYGDGVTLVTFDASPANAARWMAEDIDKAQRDASDALGSAVDIVEATEDNGFPSGPQGSAQMGIDEPDYPPEYDEPQNNQPKGGPRPCNCEADRFCPLCETAKGLR